MSKGRINDFYIQYEQLTIKFENQEKLLKETNKLVKSLNKTIESLNETVEKQNKIIEEQAKEILRLKSNNNKDSSNSSKPSSTNGFKKVITNRREKSIKKKGAQKFHKPHSLNNKLKQFIKSGNVEETSKLHEEGIIIPVSGEFDFLSDVIGVIGNNSLSWHSNGIDYYMASNSITTAEILEIAKSISVLPVSK